MKNLPLRASHARLSPHRRLKPVAAACGAMASLTLTPTLAQQAPAPAAAASAAAQTVIVTGIRGALDTSLTLKRDAVGVVDGIVAEDIGKFPDTNLAESMQRISGVSIERSPSGEGSRVTVRGVGADFNMVLLNGRQMPGAIVQSAEGGARANGSRAFDFANLSTDSISALEVYKTSRAAAPTGGIGATINIKTARPLDLRGRVASVAVKGNYDASNSRLPDSFQGSTITPEVSGIFSDVFLDGKLGIAISGSYSKRDSGSNKGYTQNGWRPFLATDDPAAGNWGAIPLPGQPGANLIVNRPTGSTLYSTPVDLRYSITSLQRERLNGQLTLQFAPSKDLRFTLDHTMASNDVKKKNQEMSTWFNFQGGPSEWTDGPVAGPISYAALWPNNDHDLAFNGGIYGEKAKLASTGFNAEWKASPRLRFEFDAHHSTASTRPNNPFGTYSVIDAAMFNQGDAYGYYTKDLPILSMPNTVLDTSKIQVTGTRFDSALSDQKIDQVQAKGRFELTESSKLLFGLAHTKVNNRSASVNHLNADWGGVGQQGDYPAGAFTRDNLPSYFSQINGHDDPRLFQHFFVFDFMAVRQRAIELAMAGGTASNPTPMTREQAEAYFSAYTDFTQGNDWRTRESSQSAYLQYDLSFGDTLPQNLSLGLRYEKTKVNSSSQILSLTNAVWSALNEIQIQTGTPTFGSGTGSYNFVLPSIDWDADLTSTLKLRASYSENIGRPDWGALTGGVSVNTTANFGGGTGSTGNPALQPLKSKNFDLSLEYYYAKSSYVAAGLFQKKISNFLSTTTVRQPAGGIHTPIGGAYYNAAIASGCAPTNPVCLRNYIFANFNGQPGVTFTGFNANGEAQGTIVGQPNDPLLEFAVSTPSNSNRGETLKGLELNLQHVFGSSGFGVALNYTKVSSGLKYINSSRDAQSALVGVSDSYNLVGFYESGPWAIRGAYNWRDGFLASTTDGAGNNPIYTEPYGQFDLSVGYKWNQNLTLQMDLINLTDGVIRQHGRTKEQLISATQTGQRIQLGARMRF